MQHLIYTSLELPEPVELFNEPLFEVLGVERQIALADTIAIPLHLVTLPTPDFVTMRFEKSTDEVLLSGALFLSMETDRETFLLYLGRFNIGLEMYPALVLVIPVAFIKLKIDASVVDLPPVVEPDGIP
jgi:hypothetical protein